MFWLCNGVGLLDTISRVHKKLIIKAGENMATFGERLRELREKAGIKQKDLAKMIGVSDGTLNLWEHNKQSPAEKTNLEVYEWLADFFGVSIAYLSGKIDDDSPQESHHVSDEEAAREADAAENEHYMGILRLYSDLSLESRESIDAFIQRLYESDKAKGTLNSQNE